MSNPIEFRLELTQEDLENELKIINNLENLELRGEIVPINPSEVPSQPLVDAGFVEAVAIIIIGSVAYIAKRLIDHWLKKKEKGVFSYPIHETVIERLFKDISLEELEMRIDEIDHLYISIPLIVKTVHTTEIKDTLVNLPIQHIIAKIPN